MKKESKIISVWESFLQLSLGEKQKSFYEKMISDAQVVHMTPIKEVFSKEEISQIKKCVKPKKKECYKNATSLCALFPEKEIKYVEGFFTCYGFPLEHAFNKVGDKYVDITGSLLLSVSEDEEYVALGEWTEKEVWEVLLKTGCYGGIWKEKYVESLTNKNSVL